MADPEVVFADEPTGALDQANSANILALLRRLTADRGRSLVGAEAVVVTGARHGGEEQILVPLHRAHHRGAEEEEDQVVVGRVARVHQVPVRGAEGPVHVLAAPVDPRERLLVE